MRALALLATACVLIVSAKADAVAIAAKQPANFDTSTCVDVSWHHIGPPGDTANDWVSSWWEPYAATYIEFVNITAANVNGSYCFTLLNARHGYVFRYYRGNTVLAMSNRVAPNGAYPRAIRTSLPLGDQQGSLRVAWISNRTVPNVTVARFGLRPDQLCSMAFATSDTFTHAELNAVLGEAYIPIMNTSFEDVASRNIRCSPSSTSVSPMPCYCDRTTCEQFVDPGWLHSAVLTNLTPGASYYYSVGEVGGPMSPVYEVRAPRAPGDFSRPVSILLMADGGFGQSFHGFTGSALHNHHKPNGANAVFAAVDRQYANAGGALDDFALFNGDLAYAQGWPYAWEFFHNMTEGVYRHVPVAASYGNHEVDWSHNPDSAVRGQDSGGECGVVAKKRFYIENPWYVLSYGPVAIVTLSSEHNMTAQVAFFAEVAPTINRTLTPWLIVQIHRPLYTSSFMEIISWEYRNAFKLLFVQYGVDMVYTGHLHFYERTCHISDDVCADWGFRDSWDDTPNMKVADRCIMTWFPTIDMAECRAQCAWNSSSCVGVLYDPEILTCFPLQCLDDPQPSPATTLGRMAVHDDLPPFYVVDGVAGAEPEPAWTFSSMYTEYKDFWQWGFSRVVVNATDLQFLHYHLDGLVHDSTHVTKKRKEPRVKKQTV